MCEILGDHQEEGGYLFPYSQKPIPILLNKDKTTSYPEIRLSPFIQNNDFFTERYAVYSYNEYFEKQNDNLYKNISYALDGTLFVDIYHIDIKNHPLRRVSSIDDLTDDSFYVDDSALYVKTNRNLRRIKISVITQGRLFNDKTSPSNRGIAFHEIGDPRNLSELEDNEVERISFDIYILFAAKRTRDKLPDVNKLRVKAKSSDFYGRKKEGN